LHAHSYPSVVFGEVVDGMDVVRTVENIRTDNADRPSKDCTIVDCGVLEDKTES
jgi:cyclophilin family peptidyl-prolyl cis-trans isomerase